MKYMIIERFCAGKVKTLYERFDQKGRMLPEGVEYIDSWIDEKVEVCFQLMESSSRKKLEEWIAHWNDLADFEIFPVIDSAKAKEKVLRDYNIVNTNFKDLPDIYSFFEAAMIYQKRKGFPIWKGYDKAVLQKDIEDQRQYKVMIGEEIIGIFSVLYADGILWREMEKGDAIYLHWIVVNPNFKGQQLFQKVLDWAKEEIAKKNLKYIRLDTWADNPAIIDFYQSYGFKIIDFFTTPNTKDLPMQQRGNEIVMMEY